MIMNNILDSKDYFTFNEVGYYLELNNCRPLDDTSLFILLKDFILESKLSAFIHFKGDCILEERTIIYDKTERFVKPITKDSSSSSVYLNLYCEIDYIDLYSLFKDYETFTNGVKVADLKYKRLELYPKSPYCEEIRFKKNGEAYTYTDFFIEDGNFEISINNIRFYREQVVALLNAGKLTDKEHLAEALNKIATLEKQLEKATSNTRNTEKQSTLEAEETLHPRTANNAAKIISALASELLKMDITQPYSKDVNGKIKAAIERQGNSISKDVIADWLKLAHEQSK